MKRPFLSIAALLAVLALVAFAASRCIRVEYVAVVPPGKENLLASAGAPGNAGPGRGNPETPFGIATSPPIPQELSFHLVAEDSEARVRNLLSATNGVAPDGFLAAEDGGGFVRDASKDVDSARLRAFGDPPAGQICLLERKDGGLFVPVFVEDPPAHRQLSAVRSCRVETDPVTDLVRVAVVLGERDAAAFAAVTGANARTGDSPGRRLAVVLGDEVLTAPLLLEPIRDGRFVVSDCGSPGEAETLARIVSSVDPASAPPTDALP